LAARAIAARSRGREPARKYDPQQLSACLQELGRETLFTQSYGPTGSRPAMLLLLRRRPGEAGE